MSYLVHPVAFCECVEDGIHRVQHRHHFHGSDSGADLCERHHVREQDGDAVKHLEEPIIMLYFIAHENVKG